jgi:6-carboxyhexanoate--CoA ligase
MWSVRMRASRGGAHISGAEGLFTEGEVEKAIKEYIKRARNHPRGEPEEIFISVEKLRAKPRELSSLRLCTIECGSPAEARRLAGRMLRAEGISQKAVAAAFGVVRGARAMRGAALVSASGGARLEPDRARGVRASRLGIDKKAWTALGRRLSRLGINTPTVKEALALASKALGTKGVLAELCVSDDPHYTTGYVATEKFGYVRIPNIKKKGSPRGGRVYLIKHGAGVGRIVEYLERRPVLIARLNECKGTRTLDELIGSANS